MNSTEKLDESDFRTTFGGLNTSVGKDEELENGDTVTNVNIEVVKTEVRVSDDDDDEGGFSPDRAAENSSEPNALKRKQTHSGFGEMFTDYESPIVYKWRRVNCEDVFASLRGSSSSQRSLEGAIRARGISSTEWPEKDQTVGAGPSLRKPLYGITHKISERRSLPTGDQKPPADGASSTGLPQQHNPSEGHKKPPSKLWPPAPGAQPSLHSLVHKMFFTLSSLSSTMTQLHSKIDLLSLEVGRIKRQVGAAHGAGEFPPPAEYRLDTGELQRLVELSSSPGDLSCRLLVQLFPHLLADQRVAGGCRTCSAHPQSMLDTFHLQLIRNYVELCYPPAASGNVWGSHCLPRLSRFFTTSSAHREMDRSVPLSTVGSLGREDHDHHQDHDHDHGHIHDQDHDHDCEHDHDHHHDLHHIHDHHQDHDRDHDHDHIHDHEHDRDQGHHQDHDRDQDHIHDRDRDQDHIHDRDQDHHHDQDDIHDRDHDHIHDRDQDHHHDQDDIHDRDHDHIHDHHHDHDNEHDHEHIHDQDRDCDHIHDRDHDHIHDRDQDDIHDREHDCDHDQDHDHIQDHDRDCDQDDIHDHVHDRDHIHDCDHDHDHDHDHDRDQDHDHDHGHWDGQRGGGGSLVPGGRGQLPSPEPRPRKLWLKPVDFKRLVIPPPDFQLPCAQHVLGAQQLEKLYHNSLSIGNFASRLLVRLFPELFTPDNLRKSYNCSGSLGKRQLDPARIKLIRHYVQLMCSRAKCDKTWNQEFVSKLDERCRRRDTEQRRVYQQQRKRSTSYSGDPGQEEPTLVAPQPEQTNRDSPQPQPMPGAERTERYNRNFCTVPLHQLHVPTVHFPVGAQHLLSTKDLKEIVQDSLSVGNFSARLLVRIFPELFTSDNLRLQYNHSGACNKMQLDPVRLRLVRHYVQAVYPQAKSNHVWHLDCIPSIDERCRRPTKRKSRASAHSRDKRR